MPSTRRRLLRSATAGAGALLAGCFAFGDSCTRSLALELDAASDADVVEQNADRPAELHRVARALVREAGTEGTATYRSVQGPPFPSRGYVLLDGRYYEPRIEVVDETAATAYHFDARVDEETNERGPDGDSVAFEDLPAHDQQEFLAGLGYPDERKFDGLDSMSGRVTVAYAEPSLVESSVLVPDPEYDYVRYQDNYVHLERTETRDATVSTYEVRLEPVADSAAELAALVRERRGMVLDDLTADQRDIVDTAIEERYDECAEYSTATEGLVERLQEVDYAKYDGTWYQVDMYESVA